MVRITLCLASIFLLLTFAILLLVRPGLEIGERRARKKDRDQKIRSFRQQGKLSKLIAKLKKKQSDVLSESRLPVHIYRIAMVACAIAGSFLGRRIFGSTSVSITGGAACLLVPMAYLSYRRTKLKNSWLDRLCASMMTLSNSYLATNDFITSVQNNLDVLDYPEPFRQFLTYITFVDSDVQSGLRRMENQVNNAYFSQWVDALTLAQKDRKLSYVTVTIVEDMRDTLNAQKESDAAMYAVWRDYLLTLFLIFCAPLILKFLMPDAYRLLATTAGGQILFFLLLLSVIFSVLMALRINRSLIE